MALEIKEVAALGKQFVADLFASEGANSIRFEAAKKVGNGRHWEVTISFLRALPKNKSGIATFVAAADRAYKAIVIDEETRAIVSIADRADAA
jgi:hypothetical protein